MAQILEQPMLEQNGDGDVTRLLRSWAAGDRTVEEQLFNLVLPHLRRLARAFLGKERRGHPWQPTELVNEVYSALVRAKDRDWRDRAHFFAIAARAMRWRLIDEGRRRNGREYVPVDGLDSVFRERSVNLDLALDVDRLLDGLAATHPDWCIVVEVKCFLGLTDKQAAEALGMPLRTLQRMWREARKWLFERMEGNGQNAATGLDVGR
jgi:RNA polymerase sigma factor (TIGR02999 family)